MYAAGEDDKTYSLLENVFAFASSAMIPIGTAGKAGQYVTPLNGSTMKRLGIIN